MGSRIIKPVEHRPYNLEADLVVRKSATNRLAGVKLMMGSHTCISLKMFKMHNVSAIPLFTGQWGTSVFFTTILAVFCIF